MKIVFAWLIRKTFPALLTVCAVSLVTIQAVNASFASFDQAQNNHGNSSSITCYIDDDKPVVL